MPPRLPQAGYGVRALQDLRRQKAVPQVAHPSERALEHRRRVADYFLERVDPVLTRCVAQLLSSAPRENVPQAMLEFLRGEAGATAAHPAAHSSTRAAQRLYLATKIGPIVAAVVTKLAKDQPSDVIPFLIHELESLDPHSHGVRTEQYSGLSSLPETSSSKSPAVANDPPAAPATEAKPTENAVANVRDVHIALLGIDGSGKTSILNVLQGNVNARVRPTIGFRPVSMSLDESTSIKLYDLGGGPRIRDIWSQYYHDVHGVIFVADAASSAERWRETGEVFRNTISHELLRDKPLLVLANKQDVQGARSVESVCLDLDIPTIPTAKAFPCSAICASEESAEADPRIEQGVEWLLETVLARFRDLQTRVSADTKVKESEERRRRLERERKVLRGKIAEAFFEKIDRSLAPDVEPAKPDDIFTAEEGANFLAAEIGVTAESLDPLAIEICSLVGQQRLALAIVGGLFCPVSKKKAAMSWAEIKELVLEVRSEIGL